jgi:hypothetical protein
VPDDELGQELDDGERVDQPEPGVGKHLQIGVELGDRGGRRGGSRREERNGVWVCQEGAMERACPVSRVALPRSRLRRRRREVEQDPLVDAVEERGLARDVVVSQEFVRTAREPVDFMVCMDLVGHRFGPEGVPGDVGASLFALGGERSQGTAALVASLKRAESGVLVRPVDAEIIPPLSDYEPFWRKGIPFLFLTAGLSRVYHTPDDTPDKLDYPKIEATARWLTRFVRLARVREAARFIPDGCGDRETLAEIADILESLAGVSGEAAIALRYARTLEGACDRTGALPSERRGELAALVGGIEARLQ